jgi:hypothetical protein
MFERVKVDNIGSAQPQAIPAEITLDDGNTLRGRFLVPPGRGLVEFLNGNAAFVDFEAYGAERMLLSKSTLRSVKLVNVPESAQLSKRLSDMNGFDPFAILGVKAGSSIEEIKTAYHRLAKIYHPDRYSMADLPSEVREYLASMVRRINAAFAALEAPAVAVRSTATGRAEPVYTSRPRA